MRGHWILLIALFPLSAAPASAQRLWLAPDPGRNIGLEITKGFFKSGSDVEFASFVVTAEGRFPVNNRLAITAALPFSRVSESGSFLSSPTSTAFGNPWIGIEAIAEPDVTVEAGIRPGITSESSTGESAQSMAFDVDFDRFEAWLPKWTSARAMAHVGRIPVQGTFVTGTFGGTLFLPSGGGGSVVYANYGVRLGVRDAHTLTSLTLTGRVGISHGGMLAGSLNSNVNQVALIVEGASGTFRPRLSIGSYVNESLREFTKAIVTVGAAVTM
jgi:hypothetical protein